MPCYQPTNFPPGFTTTGRTSYATEADCLNSCKEGACCEGTTCSVKPQCQCQGAGKVFRGVGTVCTPNLCGCCGNGETIAGKNATLYVSTDSMPTTRWCPALIGGSNSLTCPDGIQYAGCVSVKPCETPTVGAWVDTASSLSATFASTRPASACDASLEATGLNCFDRTASVFVRPSQLLSSCKIAATVDCLWTGVDSYRGNFSVDPYWAWDYNPQVSEYNALYYVFQYLTGTGISTVTQSVNTTPVTPTGTGLSWYLDKTVTVNMRLTLA